MERPTRFPDETGKLHCASIYYDVGKDGGALDPFFLRGLIPEDCVVVGGNVVVLEQFASETNAARVTMRLRDENPGQVVFQGVDISDLNPGTLAGILLLAFAGRHFTGGGPVRVRINVNVEPLTAGKLVVNVFYVMAPNVEIEE